MIYKLFNIPSYFIKSSKSLYALAFCSTILLSPCMGISDEINDATIAIDDTTSLEIKATI